MDSYKYHRVPHIMYRVHLLLVTRSLLGYRTSKSVSRTGRDQRGRGRRRVRNMPHDALPRPHAVIAPQTEGEDGDGRQGMEGFRRQHAGAPQ